MINRVKKTKKPIARTMPPKRAARGSGAQAIEVDMEPETGNAQQEPAQTAQNLSDRDGQQPMTREDFGRFCSMFEEHIRAMGELSRRAAANQTPQPKTTAAVKVNVNSFEKLQADTSLRDFISWRS